MQVSSKGKYSVRAVLDIAQHSDGSPVPLAAISQREGISLLFLEQLFQQLRKGNIVKSVRGRMADMFWRVMRPRSRSARSFG